MNEQTLVALYDTAADADAAVRDLKAANVPAEAISQHAKSGTMSGAPRCANKASGPACLAASRITIPQYTTAASTAVRPS